MVEAHRPKFKIRPAAALAWALLTALGAIRAEAGAVAAATDSTVVGMIGSQKITDAELILANPADFDRLQNDYEAQRRRAELKYAESRHDLLVRELNRKLDAAAVEAEAQARGVTPDEVRVQLKSATPSEEEIRAFYEANRSRIHQPFEAVAKGAREYLTKRQNEALSRQFYDELRAKHGISGTIEPFRVSVAASGPARGGSRAPITIVEFADYQCPFCKAAEDSLHALMERYPDSLRIVFRNLPLSEIHPNAKIAAEAGVCADRQGKFWPMHDAMYGNQGALSLDTLKGTASRLGLDPRRFAACLDDAATGTALATDVGDARSLGLEGTPYFFVNGRPIDGNAPLETFEKIIDDELRQFRQHPG